MSGLTGRAGGLTGRAVFPAPLDPQVVAGRRRQLLDTAAETIGRGPFAPTRASLAGYHVPDWYLDAKFGIFIHWLAASVPAYGDQAFLDDLLTRTVELVERYDPELVWFDWWIEEPAFAPGTAVYDIERGGTRGISARPFQNDSSTSRRAWAYLTDNDYKTADEIVIDLVDAVSKNGVLLLNIGPRPDGTIDPTECRLLEQIGQWLATNGEAIYGTTLRLFDGEVAAVHLLGVDSGLPFRRDASGLTVSLPARPARPGPPAVGVLRIDLRPAGPPPRAESAIID